MEYTKDNKLSVENSELCFKSDMNQSIENSSKNTIKLYFRRYLILLVLSLALFANGEAWMTFGSVEIESSQYFNQSRETIIWFSNIFLVAYAVEAIPCSFMPQQIGLKGTLLAGIGLNLMGSVFRLLGTIMKISPYYRFITCLFGNLWFGLAQGFLLNIPSLVSAVWFGENERPVSTAVAYMSNAVGVGIGFLDIYLLVGGKSGEIVASGFIKIASFEFVLCLLLMLFSIFIVIEEPPTPPSQSQFHKGKVKCHTSLFSDMKTMIKTMIKLFTNPQAAILLGIFATNYASYVIMFVFLSMMVFDLVVDYSHLTGYIAAIGIILGGIFTVIIGIIMFKTKNKYNQKLAYLINIACALPLIPVLYLAATNQLSIVSCFVAFIIYFSVCPVYISVGSEILADVTYPVDPNITSNQSLILGNILGAIINNTFVLIKGNAKHLAVQGLVISFYIINFILLLTIKFTYRRQLAETS